MEIVSQPPTPTLLAAGPAGTYRADGLIASFPQLIEPKGFRGGSENRAWSVNVLWSKSEQEFHKDLLAAIKGAAQTAFPGGIPAEINPSMVILDGDQKDYDGYAGHWYMTVRLYETSGGRRNKPPRVYSPAGELLTVSDSDQYPDAGDIVNVKLRVYGTPKWKRVSTSLESLQRVRPYAVFGAGGNKTDEFGAVEGYSDMAEPSSEAWAS